METIQNFNLVSDMTAVIIDTTHPPIDVIINTSCIDTHHSIKITDCPKCNSNLPISKTSDKGICKCEYCGKEVYVW